MSGKKGMKHYPIPLKEQAVRMHIEDGLTTREVTKRLGIVDEQRVKQWCITYRKKGMHGLLYQPKGRPRKSEQLHPKDELKRLRMENELLRNFLCEVGRS